MIAAPASTSHRSRHAPDEALLREQAFVNGQWIEAADGATLAVTDPATGERIGSVPALGAAETRRAIEAAAAAMPTWAARTAPARAGVLRRWHDLMLERIDDLAALLMREQGKPLAEARGEIAYAAGFVEWFAEEAKRTYGEIIPSHAADRRLLVIQQPVGVVAAITPWNFPCAMVARKLAPALAAGCGVVLKPATETPFSALALAVLAQEAGLPPGLFNVVTGEAQPIGAELTANPTVRKLSFTGSTDVGRRLLAQCAPTVKKVSMELGGSAPFLVFDDADLDAAVEGAVQAKFRNAGQTCVCADRFYVQASVYDAFAARLAHRAERLKVGPGDEPGSEIGPLIHEAAVVKVEAHVADALARGAHIARGGRRHSRGGSFYEPTVITGVTPAMQVAQDETFGPVAPLLRFDTEAEAIALANDSEAGLAAYVYTRDIGRLWRVAEALEVGMVGANTGLISTEVAPFGGVKQSGMGREGSRHGISDYLETKYVCLAV